MPTPDPSRRLRVAVLLGGQSTEHDVSIASGLKVLASLDPNRYEPLPITIERDGTWLVGHAPEPVSLEADATGSAPGSEAGVRSAEVAQVGVHGALDELRRTDRVDVVFIALHGAFGEDGTIQGLLTLAGVPFTGSGVLASALAMDKARAKDLFHFHGIPVARHFVVQQASFLDSSMGDQQSIVDLALRTVGLPCVIKPVSGGSSVGTHVVRRHDEALPALVDALGDDPAALVEEFLAGTEVTCGVLGGGPWEGAQALPVTEIVPKGGTFFDFRAKYSRGGSDEITPARLPDEVIVHVQDLAVRVHEALGCEGMSRTDFIVRDGKPHVLETNTIPGMTETSLLPQAAAAAGIPFPRLVDRLIASALRRKGLPRP